MNLTKEQIIEAIDELFGDTSVSPEETLEALMDIRGNLDMKIGAIEADLERDGG